MKIVGTVKDVLRRRDKYALLFNSVRAMKSVDWVIVKCDSAKEARNLQQAASYRKFKVRVDKAQFTVYLRKEAAEKA